MIFIGSTLLIFGKSVCMMKPRQYKSFEEIQKLRSFHKQIPDRKLIQKNSFRKNSEKLCPTNHGTLLKKNLILEDGDCVTHHWPWAPTIGHGRVGQLGGGFKRGVPAPGGHDDSVGKVHPPETEGPEIRRCHRSRGCGRRGGGVR